MSSTEAEAARLLERTLYMPSFTKDRLEFDSAFIAPLLTWDLPPRAAEELTEAPAWWLPKVNALSLDRSTPAPSTLDGVIDGLDVALRAFRAVGVHGDSGAGKSTLATWTARRLARQFLSASREASLPVLVREDHSARALAEIERAARLVQEGNRVVVLLDGLPFDGLSGNDLDALLPVDLAAASGIRLVIFSRRAQPALWHGEAVHWLHLAGPDLESRRRMLAGLASPLHRPVVEIEPSAVPSTVLLTRLAGLARLASPASAGVAQIAQEFLVEMFHRMAQGSTNGASMRSLLTAAETVALTFHRRAVREFSAGAILDALPRSIDGAALSDLDAARFLPPQDIGNLLFTSVASRDEASSPRFRFAHDVIGDALVTRALAARTNTEILAELARLPLGVTRVRLATAVVHYLRDQEGEQDATGRWRALAHSLARASDLFETGLLVALAAGAYTGVEHDDAVARFQQLQGSRVGLDRARAEELLPSLDGAIWRLPGADKRSSIFARQSEGAPGRPHGAHKGFIDALHGAKGEAFSLLVRAALADEVLRSTMPWAALAGSLVSEPGLFWEVARRIAEPGSLIEAAGRLGVPGLGVLTFPDIPGELLLPTVAALGNVLGERATEALEGYADSGDWEIRREVALTLGERGDDVGTLVRLLKDPEPNVGFAVVTSATRSSSEWAERVLDQVLVDGPSGWTVLVCLYLDGGRRERVRVVLEELLVSSDDRVATAAAVCLGDRETFDRRGGLGVLRAFLRLPDREMRRGHVLTSEPGGDVEATIAWAGHRVIEAIMNKFSPAPQRDDASSARLVTALLRLAALRPDENRQVPARTLRVVREAGLHTVRYESPIVREQMHVALSALGAWGVDNLGDLWARLLAASSGRETIEVVHVLEVVTEANLAASILGERMRHPHITNVLDGPDRRALLRLPRDYVIAGVARLVRRGGLSLAALDELANLAADLMARHDLTPVPEDLAALDALVCAARRTEGWRDRLDVGDGWAGMAYAGRLEDVRHMLHSGRGAEAAGPLEDVPEGLREREWLRSMEYVSFVLGDLERTVSLGKKLLGDFPGVGVGVSCRAANMLRRPDLALTLTSSIGGLDYVLLKAQAALIDGSLKRAAELLRADQPLALRLARLDPYLICLHWLAGGEQSDEVWSTLIQRTRTKELVAFAAEFRHPVYAHLSDVTGLVQALEAQAGAPPSSGRAAPNDRT